MNKKNENPAVRAEDPNGPGSSLLDVQEPRELFVGQARRGNDPLRETLWIAARLDGGRCRSRQGRVVLAHHPEADLPLGLEAAHLAALLAALLAAHLAALLATLAPDA